MKSSSSSSFSGFNSASVMPIPLLEMQSDLFNNAGTMTNASSNVFTATFVTTFLVVLAKPYISPKSIADSDEPSRKRKRECSGSSSDLSHDEMWTEFHCFMAFHSATGHYL